MPDQVKCFLHCYFCYSSWRKYAPRKTQNSFSIKWFGFFKMFLTYLTSLEILIIQIYPQPSV